MLRRIFFAINLLQSARDEIASLQKNLPELPMRLTKPENLHITLLFYGNASDRELPEISKIVKETVGECEPFSFELSKIAYGPSEKEPRMVWFKGEPTKELISLHNKLAKALSESVLLKFTPDQRPFSLHLTLARINEFKFKSMELEERPRIDEHISLKIFVSSIEIMESELKKSGQEYTICESISLA